MRSYINFKEVGKDYIGKTTYVGNDLTIKFIIDFFGLTEPDVEWYEIEIEGVISATNKPNW